MAYQYNIPLATDQLSKSQGDIQDNFNALGAIAGNTSPASSSINGTVGFNFVYLASQVGAIPPITFPVSNIALYSATRSTINELYINKTNQATVVQVPATASILSSNSSPGASSNGWSYFPSGILMLWGTVASPTGSSHSSPAQTITYANGGSFPVFSQIFNIQLTSQAPQTSTAYAFMVVPGTINPGASQFGVSWSGSIPSSGAFLSYLIIGIPASY